MEILYSWTYPSPLGSLYLLGDGDHVTGLCFESDDLYDRLIQDKTLLEKEAVFQTACHWLDLYFQGLDPGFLPPIKAQGSPFQMKVWARLLEIPYGQVETYGALAQKLALDLGKSAMSAQAVGGAVGRNPIAILIPCHRVVGSRGDLVGYRGGLKRKAWLLNLENSNAYSFEFTDRNK